MATVPYPPGCKSIESRKKRASEHLWLVLIVSVLRIHGVQCKLLVCGDDDDDGDDGGGRRIVAEDGRGTDGLA